MGLSFSESAERPLLRALIGLARAADAGAREPDEAVFSLLREGLAHLEALDPSDLLARIRAEKARLIPGCAACASPCGRTSDPTATDLTSAAPEILARKTQVLRCAAAGAEKAEALSLLRAVFALGEDWTLDKLAALLPELQL